MKYPSKLAFGNRFIRVFDSGNRGNHKIHKLSLISLRVEKLLKKWLQTVTGYQSGLKERRNRRFGVRSRCS